MPNRYSLSPTLLLGLSPVRARRPASLGPPAAAPCKARALAGDIGAIRGGVRGRGQNAGAARRRRLCGTRRPVGKCLHSSERPLFRRCFPDPKLLTTRYPSSWLHTNPVHTTPSQAALVALLPSLWRAVHTCGNGRCRRRRNCHRGHPKQCSQCGRCRRCSTVDVQCFATSPDGNFRAIARR